MEIIATNIHHDRDPPPRVMRCGVVTLATQAYSNQERGAQTSVGIPPRGSQSEQKSFNRIFPSFNVKLCPVE